MAGPRFAFVPAKWLQPDSPLDSLSRLVLCVLCQYVNGTTRAAWPSIATIATCSRLSHRTVQRCIARLETAGAITVQRRKEGSVHDSNLYTVLGYDPEGGVPYVGRGGGVRDSRGVVSHSHPNSSTTNKRMNKGRGRSFQAAPPNPMVDEAVDGMYAGRSQKSKRITGPATSD